VCLKGCEWENGRCTIIMVCIALDGSENNSFLFSFLVCACACFVIYNGYLSTITVLKGLEISF
jgi:hypothetical protein